MKNKIALFVIIVVGTVLRFFQLGINPPSLTWDEAAWGYNAYSLGIDGRDEFGRFLPHDYLESFGDFKPPVYAYADIIPVKIWGLNEFSTRFPSAFFGVLTVLLTYFLVKEIFKRSLQKESIALMAAGILAISPWHINLSRAAFEANVATFFIVGGVLFFISSVQGKKWLLVLSAIFFVLSIYTFNTARIVSPLLILFLAGFNYKRLLNMKKETVFAIIIGLLLVLPTVKFLLSPQANLRFREVNIFSDVTVVERVNQEIENDHNAWWSKIIHNRRITFGVLYIQHYFDNLNPAFLFIKGDGNPKFSTQEVGELYIWEIPFLICGILYLFKKREGMWWIIPLWLIIGIIPAATARETPHALRIETTLPTFQILSAYGVITTMAFITRKRFLVVSILSVIVFLNTLYYLHGYYAHYPRIYSGEWQYGYKDSINFVQGVQDKYDEIEITTSLGRPYVYYLFYLKTAPSYFRSTAVIHRDAFGFVDIEKFGKYQFGDNLENIAKKNSHNLFINSPSKVPNGVKVLKTFYELNGESILVAYER